MPRYQAERRVAIGWFEDDGTSRYAHDVRIHEDRGDGRAACAVGTQMGYTKPFQFEGEQWITLGAGKVTCELCAVLTEDRTRRPGGAPGRRLKAGAEGLHRAIA